MITFQLQSDYIELHKLLKLTGLLESGGSAKQAIAHGLVRVDGAVEKRKACKIRKSQIVEYEGEQITVA